VYIKAIADNKSMNPAAQPTLAKAKGRLNIPAPVSKEMRLPSVSMNVQPPIMLTFLITAISLSEEPYILQKRTHGTQKAGGLVVMEMQIPRAQQPRRSLVEEAIFRELNPG
jgi:hypothetical protein